MFTENSVSRSEIKQAPKTLNRAKIIEAKKAYVLSDMPFYEKLGFKKDKRFSFYWKK